MRILITNDDGINAPGLVTLTKIAKDLAGPDGEVWTVAPAFEQSGVGHCISYTHPMINAKLAERRYAVEGSPADCVLAGNTITATKTGTCVVTASKASDDVYEAATSPSITVSVTVAKPVVVTPPPVVKVAPTEHVIAVAPTGKPVLVGTPLIKPIIFGPDSAKLDAGDLKQLRAAATLAKAKDMSVLVTGFVKSAGATTMIEKLLASSRARAVATYLRKLGMKVSISYAGYGAYNKVAPTANDRRVEIRWIAKD